MKKLFTIAAACGTVMFLSSCGSVASLLSHGKSPVFMMQSPNDIEVACNGTKMDLSKEVFAAKSRTHDNGIYKSTVTTSYYATAVKLPSKKNAKIELYSPSQNKRATVELKAKASRALVWCDILFTAGGGLLIDIPTGNLKKLTPTLIDVESALAGKPRKEWLSQGKMRRMAKKGADKAAKKKY